MTTKAKFNIGRRSAIKTLGLSSAALFAQTFGNSIFAQPSEVEKIKKPLDFTGRSQVSFTTGNDRLAMIEQVMKPFEKEIRRGLKGKQLIIKPNMVSTSRPLCATHVDAMRGLLEYIKPFYHGQVIIAEATAGNGESSPGFKNYGYLDLEKDYNVKFIDINLSNGKPFWIIDKDLHMNKIQMSEMFFDPNNYFISISRLKTHNSVIMTAGTKNMVMAAPLNIPESSGKPRVNYKSQMHAGGPRWLHYNMFLVAQVVRPDFTIIDGVEGMEGNGPASGTSVDHRIALAGHDVLAVDSICAKLMDIPLENVGYLGYCADNGLGITDRSKIDIIGSENPDNFVKSYKLHENAVSQLQWKDPLDLPK